MRTNKRIAIASGICGAVMVAICVLNTEPSRFDYILAVGFIALAQFVDTYKYSKMN